jgi:DNA-binding NarL/FixJ family response regulator
VAADHHALIVTKEANLGAQSAKVLEQDYACEVVVAGPSGTRDSVRRALTSTRFDIVIAQQRMSPYSASDVLRDVNAENGAMRPSVICLAYDESDRNTFIREGGAAFILLEPGRRDLQQAITEALRQVRQHRQFQSTNKLKVLAMIDGFTQEHDFQPFVVAIFQELRYAGVRLTHGPTEKGKDIVCYEVNKMGRNEYVGVQIKRGDVRSSGGKSSLTDLWRQALEAFNSPVHFDDGDHYLDKFVVIVSGTIKELARDKLSDFVKANHAHRRIFFLDREELADVVVMSCPQLMAAIE